MTLFRLEAHSARAPGSLSSAAVWCTGTAAAVVLARSSVSVMIEAVVFDLDGVLVDSEPVWEQVRRQVVAGRGGHCFGRAAPADGHEHWGMGPVPQRGPRRRPAAGGSRRWSSSGWRPATERSADAGCGRGGPGAGRALAAGPGELVAGSLIGAVLDGAALRGASPRMSTSRSGAGSLTGHLLAVTDRLAFPRRRARRSRTRRTGCVPRRPRVSGDRCPHPRYPPSPTRSLGPGWCRRPR